MTDATTRRLVRQVGRRTTAAKRAELRAAASYRRAMATREEAIAAAIAPVPAEWRLAASLFLSTIMRLADAIDLAALAGAPEVPDAPATDPNGEWAAMAGLPSDDTGADPDDDGDWMRG